MMLKKIMALCATALVVAGCSFSPTEGIETSVTVKARGQAVVIAGPPGFCVDQRTVDQSAAGAFVFLSDCANDPSANGPSIARVPISAVLTATVSNSDLPGADQGANTGLIRLEQFLETPIGQLTLGKSGNPATITVLLMERTSDAVYAYVEDTTLTTNTGESARYWRAFTRVANRLVALSATGYDRYDPEQLRIKRIIEAFVAALHTANAG